jgi:hypothetical protein
VQVGQKRSIGSMYGGAKASWMICRKDEEGGGSAASLYARDSMKRNVVVIILLICELVC